MGHLEGSGSPLVEKFPLTRRIFATPAFWNDTLFIAGESGLLEAYALNPASGLFNPTPVSHSSAIFSGMGATASVSSNGKSHGIVWATETRQFGPPTPPETAPPLFHLHDPPTLPH